MEKDFQNDMSCDISIASIRLPAAGDIMRLRKGRGDWRRLSAKECDQLEGAQIGPNPHDC